MRILSVTRYARQAMEYGSEDLHIDSSCGIASYNQIHRGGLNLVCICGDYDDEVHLCRSICSMYHIRYCGYN